MPTTSALAAADNQRDSTGIDSGTIGKVDVKPERLVDFSLVDALEKSGFIDAV
jgi:hypothetical protein